MTKLYLCTVHMPQYVEQFNTILLHIHEFMDSNTHFN